MSSILNSIIRYSYYILFFATPLLLTPWNYELFEFNKMLFVYVISTIVGSSWMAKQLLERKPIRFNTPLTIPLILFFVIHLVGTIYSIDPYMSVYGYYGRFNGGVLSLISYIVLYFIFINQFTRNEIGRIVAISLSSGVIVAAYGIAQHFGIDAHLWVQDVQNRVFSTLGQPNWLAAYMAILLPISISFIISTLITSERKSQMVIWLYGFMVIIPLIFYSALLFTKSRSGFLAFWCCNILFWILTCVPLLFGKLTKELTEIKKRILKTGVVITGLFVLTTFLVGAPIGNLSTPLTDLSENASSEQLSQQPSNEPVEFSENIITDSGNIRQIVWKGALNAALSKPWLGYGPETFAWVYYRFRPTDHNLTSEWDFLYNKAHNEYLNYAATLGFVGLGSNIIIILTYIWWNRRLIRPNKQQDQWIHNRIILIGLFSGWLSMLVTNFFGFSVVVTSLFFFLIPAMSFVVSDTNTRIHTNDTNISVSRKIMASIMVMTGIYILITIINYWRADVYFANGYSFARQDHYQSALDELQKATKLRPFEPVYQNELGGVYAALAFGTYEQNNATASAEFAQSAIKASNDALTTSPSNVSFWKARTRMFYTLSQIDPTFLEETKKSIEVAVELAPTDAKILYNLGIVQNAMGENDAAIETLLKTMELKPNYRDAAWALSLFYEEEKNTEEREKWLRYILEKINLNDNEAKQKLGV